jgi:muramoyltetrapeptide carboxypeptidase
MARSVVKTIGIAAASSPFPQRDFLKGVRYLESLGFSVSYRSDIFTSEKDPTPYLAGSDARRVAELTRLFANPQIDAILFARGGYGVMRLLDQLPWARLKKTPKIVMGYSDVTPLLNILWQRYRYPTLHGPMVATDYSQNWAHFLKQDTLHFFNHYSSPTQILDNRGKFLKKGTAKGVLVGGCLTLLASTLGTPYEIETKGSLLCLEDTGESLYQVDRMLTQLKLAGKFSHTKGLIIGQLYKGPKKEKFHKFLKYFFKDFSGPIIVDFPFGHCVRPRILPIGRSALIRTPFKGLEIL